MSERIERRSLFDRAITKRAIAESFRKLRPSHQARNPVMFVVSVGAALTSALFVHALMGDGDAPAGFIFGVSLWLWFTVLFANFAEAMAEGRGKAQADALRRSRTQTQARKLRDPKNRIDFRMAWATDLRKG